MEVETTCQWLTRVLRGMAGKVDAAVALHMFHEDFGFGFVALSDAICSDTYALRSLVDELRLYHCPWNSRHPWSVGLTDEQETGCPIRRTLCGILCPLCEHGDGRDVR